MKQGWMSLAALACIGALLPGCNSPVSPSVSPPERSSAAEPLEPLQPEEPRAAAAESPEPALPAEKSDAGAASETAAAPEKPAPPPVAAPSAAPEGAAAAASQVFSSRPGDWAMWGGSPHRNLVNTREKGIPQEWDIKTRKNIKWTADLGSQSYGNPVIAEGRILVGTNNQAMRNPKIEGDKGILMCFREEDGKFLWQAVHDKLESGRVNDWPEQGICSSPVVENGRVYYVSNRAELICADLNGFLDGENNGPFTGEKYRDPIDADFIWVLDMFNDLAVFPHNLATSSPLIAGDLVYVLTSNGVDKDHITIPAPQAPSFIAVNKHTGELVWENAAPGESILHGQWSCPSYGVAAGRPQVVFAGGNGWVYSFEPLTGELLWEFDLNPKDAVYILGGLGTRNYIIATPVFHEERVYIAVGQDPEHGEGIGHLYSIDATGEGDVTTTKQVWHYGGKEFRRTLSTVAVYEDLVYAADLSGFLHCLDKQTGRPHWVHDMLAAVWGSPAVIDGKVFLGDEDGDVVVLRAGDKGPKVPLLFETNMDNSVYTTPVAAGGVLYIVNRTTLFAIAEKKE
jgi:outer membrane protein assembly factor BamB